MPQWPGICFWLKKPFLETGVSGVSKKGKRHCFRKQEFSGVSFPSFPSLATPMMMVMTMTVAISLSPSATKSNQGPTSCLHCLHLNIRLRLKKGTKDRLQKVILDVNSCLCKPQVSLAALLHYFVFFQILMADQEEPLKGQTSAIQRVRHASQKLESADTTAFLSKFFLLYHQTRRY